MCHDTLPDLDLDILGIVCDLIDDVSTINAVSHTSHALRQIAVKRLLSMKPIALKDQRSVRTFHEFVSVDPESRIPFVRSLNISIFRSVTLSQWEQGQKEAAQAILDLLERVTHLRSLTLPHPERTLRYLADPRICDAITRVSTLHDLGMLDTFDKMETIVKLTHSVASHRVLRISLDTLPALASHEDDRGIKIAQLDALLCHLAPTLEVLDIIGNTPIQLDVKGTGYPGLRSLMSKAPIVGDCWKDIRMDLLVSKFPALEDTLSVPTWVPESPDAPNLQRVRALNEVHQAQRSWRHLDRVIEDVLGLYVLGLVCPVRHLMVESLSSRTRSHMAELLRSASPTHLKLSIILYLGGDVLQGLLPPESIPRLTHLILLLSYANAQWRNRFPSQWNGRDPSADTMQWSPLLVSSQSSAMHSRC